MWAVRAAEPQLAARRLFFFFLFFSNLCWVHVEEVRESRELNGGSSLSLSQIAELEAQCHEASQEKQKNAQLAVRVQELEAELSDKEQVRQHRGHMTATNSRAAVESGSSLAGGEYRSTLCAFRFIAEL